MRLTLAREKHTMAFSQWTIVASVACLAALSTSGTAQAADRFPCRDVHTFDFWEGTFDAKPWDKPDAPAAGQLHNTREYDGCVFVERWTSPRGNGMSIVFYDATRKTWRMFWNDDSNSSNVFDEGVYRDGAMRFTGWVLDPQGQRIMASNVLQNVSPDVIRHIYSTSADSGKTWTTRSDGRFVRVKSGGR